MNWKPKINCGTGVDSCTFRSTYCWRPKMIKTAFVMTMLLTTLLSGVVSGQQKPTTGYAPVNGLKMYYEIHGSGEPVVLLHGAFMAISGDWSDWVGELSKTRKVIAVEMQGHGRTADINRDITFENLADDVAGLLDYLKIQARTSSVTAWALASRCSVRFAIRKKCERLSAFRPRSAATAGSKKASTHSPTSRRKPSKARRWRPSTRN